MNAIQVYLYINKYCKKCSSYWKSVDSSHSFCMNKRITKNLLINWYPSMEEAIPCCKKGK